MKKKKRIFSSFLFANKLDFDFAKFLTIDFWIFFSLMNKTWWLRVSWAVKRWYMIYCISFSKLRYRKWILTCKFIARRISWFYSGFHHGDYYDWGKKLAGLLRNRRKHSKIKSSSSLTIQVAFDLREKKVSEFCSGEWHIILLNIEISVM